MSMFEEKPWLRRVVWSLLLLLAWALSWFTCGFWIILQPFETLFDGFPGKINESIERVIVWPRYVGRAIIDAQEDFPNPLKNPHFRSSQQQQQQEQPAQY